LPYSIGHWAVMAVNQEAVAFVVALLGMACKVDLADAIEWKIREIVQRPIAVVGGRYKDVINVEQEFTAGSLDNRPDEVRLTHGRLCESDVSRRVFKKDSPTYCALHLIDMRANLIK